MKGLPVVVIALFLLLAGCAAKEEQAAVQHEEMPEIQEQNQTETVSDVHAAKAMEHEQVMEKAPALKELDYTTSKWSANGAYNISYTTIGGDIRVDRIHSWELTIKDADGQPVNNAKVMVDGDMPEHGHGLPTHPVVTRAGFDGLYRVDNMKFSMPGWWVITINLMASEVPDSVSFNLNITD